MQPLQSVRPPRPVRLRARAGGCRPGCFQLLILPHTLFGLVMLGHSVYDLGALLLLHRGIAPQILNEWEYALLWNGLFAVIYFLLYRRAWMSYRLLRHGTMATALITRVEGRSAKKEESSSLTVHYAYESHGQRVQATMQVPARLGEELQRGQERVVLYAAGRSELYDFMPFEVPGAA